MGMFDRLVLIGASVSIVGVFIYYRREKKYSQMMKDVDKMSVYEFDKIIDYKSLPNGQVIALRATTQSDFTKNGRMSSNTEVIYSTIAQSKTPTQMFSGQQGFYFDVVNPQGMELNILKTHGKSTLLYDLNKISKDFKYNEFQSNMPLNLFQRIQNMRGELNFAEYAILPNEQYIFVGRITNNGSKPTLMPRIIMGDDKIKFLKYLDLYLAKNNTKGKYCLAGCVGIVGAHFVLTRLFPETFKSKRQVVFKNPSSTRYDN